MINVPNLKEKIEREISFIERNQKNSFDEKEYIKKIHSSYKDEFIRKNRDFWFENKKIIENSLIDGADIEVDKISARLIEIPKNSQGELSKIFRLARFNWSIPTSNGFGRRIRFLVWDDYHNSLIGIIGLTDPVFNMKDRDFAIDWDVKAREKRLVSILDAFALGALPPYSSLLGGKLVACLLNSLDIHEIFEFRYGKSVGTISQENKNAKLAAITTTSLFGRSSVYNRVKLNGKNILEPVGYTSGFGHFHFSAEVFDLLRQLLNEKNPEIFSSYTFGQGPNWKIRVIREGLKLLGIDQSRVKHGFKRQIFINKCYQNSIGYLKSNEEIGKLTAEPSDDITSAAKERWMIPRASRLPLYKEFNKKTWVKEIEQGL